MQQKRQSVVKNKNDMNSLKSLNTDVKPKVRPKTGGSKIKVVVRKRPVNEIERKRKDCDIITVKDSCTLYIDEPRCKVDMTKYNERHEFIVDKVFNETVDNYTVYVNTIKPLLVDVFKNSCVCSCFAYGQTGSGKTYTMLGSQPYGQSNTPGIFQYAANDIFDFLKIYDTDNSQGIFISFYEIYCGKLYDLLQNRKMVAALENGKKEVVVKDLKVLRVQSKEELVSKMVEGVLLRKIGVNSQNDESSRSHAILNIDLKDLNKNSSLGKIAFIDLAGSERGADTVAQSKQTQTDGANINRSLLALKECIRAMDAEKSHIPFRDSELTKVLRDIFVGKSKSIMIANISPTISCCEQTLNTLRYSSRVKNFKNKVVANEEENNNDYKAFNLESQNAEYDQCNNMYGYNNLSSVSTTVDAINIPNNNIEQGKINIKINDSKLKTNNMKNRTSEKGRDSISFGKTNAPPVELDSKIKKKKKSIVNSGDKNLYNNQYASKKLSIAQQNYVYTDTSDFSSIDEMNCNLNNNNQKIYMNNRSTRAGNRTKNRNSCESNIPKKEKKSTDTLTRHSVGNVMLKYNNLKKDMGKEQFNEKIKDSSNHIIKNGGSQETTNSSIYLNEEINNYISKTNNNANTNNNNNSLYISHVESTSNCNSYKIENVPGGFNDSFNKLDTIQNRVEGIINGNEKECSHYMEAYGNGEINYDYNQMDKNSLLNFRKTSDTGGNIYKENMEGNSHENVNTNNLLNVNALNSKYVGNNVYNINSPNAFSGNNNINTINGNTGNMLNGYVNNETTNNYGNWKGEQRYDNESLYNNNNNNITSDVMNNANVNNKRINNDILDGSNGFIYMNDVLKNCLDIQNITNYISEETKQILNTILLSKHNTDKESLLKNYINKDISSMSAEELDFCCQIILEKRQIVLNNLLTVFRKNVDTQTNNETSDLKKDLLMCHICGDGPDDQFHYYVYSRIEKDLTNLMGLRQIWCESENLRLLHQHLSLEYQNRLASASYHTGNENGISVNRNYINNLKNQEEFASNNRLS